MMPPMLGWTARTAAQGAAVMAEAGKFVHVLALKLDPRWRRLPEATRLRDARAFADAVEASAERVRTFTYSMVGLRAEVDLLFWRLGPSVEALEETAAALLQSGMGRFMTVGHTMLGLVRPSSYVKTPTTQEQAMFTGERDRYLIVYPFVKTAEWYLLDREARQKMMNEHMKLGHHLCLLVIVLCL
jgi:chlorite dismutase